MSEQGCSEWVEPLERDGCVLLSGLLDQEETEEVARSLGSALQATDEEAPLRSQEGTVYAARNVLKVWPEGGTIWRRPPLVDLLRRVLGVGCGLVRVLFFDKPPGQTWALPWHKDLTITVRNNRLPSGHFCKPTFKAGVSHVEAPEAVLVAMLTARLHFDDVTEENGPLKVIPGSHRDGTRLVLGDVPPRTIFARAGDVFLMRPMLAHASGRSHPDTRRHRRILHLEFAAGPTLPDGYAWHTFLPVLSET